MLLIFLVTVFASSFIFLVDGVEWQVISKSTIDIKPGAGVVEAFHEAEPYICKFVYKTQGGTKEIWDFEYAENSKKESKCIVKRPSGSSYLFFEEFSLSVNKGQVLTAYLEKKPEVVITEDEYLIDHKTREVRYKEGSFKSQLNLVELVFKKKQTKKKNKSDL